MHVEVVPNRNSKPAVLLRESYREGKKVKKRTIANISKLPMEQVEAIRRILKGEKLVPVGDAFEIVEGGTRLHGHVDAVLRTMRKLGFAKIIGARTSRNRELVIAMVAARIIEPQSKLATATWWPDTTLPELLGLGETNEDELYEAMDWLVDQQSRIEKRLAARHLSEGSLALYDLTSSYFEGSTCPLAARGHNRDGKKGKLQVNYGLLTDTRGVPVSVSVFEGNTADPKTLLPQVEKVRKQFGVEKFVLVGDRGMLTQKQVDAVRDIDGIDWIGALRPEAIKKLVESEAIQLGLFDERNLFELEHPDFPSERLVACRNPDLAQRRARKRKDLLEATVGELEKVQRMVGRGRLRGQDNIGVRVGKVVNKYKVAKHFTLDIGEDTFEFEIRQDTVAREAALDGIYVIRTSLSKSRMDAEHAVRSYKMLSQAERAFRSLKTVDLLVRPIHHRLESRVRAHIFLCMLAYYVLWHMMDAWRPLLFADEELEAKLARDPVAAAKRSDSAILKAGTKQLEDGSRVHSFRTLLRRLSTIVKNTCRCPGARPDEPTFDLVTPPDEKQQRALELLNSITL